MQIVKAILASLFRFCGVIISWFFRLTLIKKIIVLLVVIGLVWFTSAKVAGQSTNKSQYQTATVERGTLITSVTSSGSVTSASTATITTQSTGVVSSVSVQNGDYVNQGDTIATVTLDQDSQQRQTQAYASYLGAQNNLNSAKAKLNSLQSALFKANQAFVTDRGVSNPSDDQKADPRYIEENAEWLQAEADYNNQQNVIAQAQASLSSAWYSYAQTSATITAPISGTISNLSITAGSPITGTTSNNSSNNSVSTQTVGNITLKDAKATATVNLTEIDIVKIKVGQKVTMTLDAFPDQTYTGKVSAINTSGSVSSGVTTYPTTITFDSAPEKLYPNMAVDATIILDIKPEVLLVPTSAIQTVNGESTVRILKNGKQQPVSVTIGGANDTQTEVTSGLQEGDTVIIGTIAPQTSGSTTTSPFGGTGFGGNRGFGGSGGGGVQRAVFIQRGG